MQKHLLVRVRCQYAINNKTIHISVPKIKIHF